MEAIQRVINTLTVMIFAVLVCTVFLGVISRLTGIPIVWTEEASRFLFIWLIYLAGFITISKGLNITFDLIIDALPNRMWKVVFTLVNIISAAFLLILVVFGAKIAIMNMNQYTSVLRIPMGWIYMAIPIGASGMLLSQIETYIKLMRKRDEVL